jgi:HD domain
VLPDWAVVTPPRRAHIERVVALLEQWAAALRVTQRERDRWIRSGWLHDALRDLAAASELDHGRLCADRLVEAGERDQGLLDAVRYHSVGYAGWDDVGRMLYLADYLEPGRRHDVAARTALRARVPFERDAVLREVARQRVERNLRDGWPLCSETVAFWNQLAAV